MFLIKDLNKNVIGLLTGLLIAGFHFLWLVIVAFGFGKIVLDWIYWLHFLNNPFQIAAFDIGRAVLPLLFTFIVGYILGWICTAAWNMYIKNYYK